MVDRRRVPVTDLERPVRRAEFDDLISESVRSVRWVGDHLVMDLAGDSGLQDRVRSLVDREHACCSFFTFTVAGIGGEVAVDIAVPSGRRDNLSALAERAVRLSS